MNLTKKSREVAKREAATTGSRIASYAKGDPNAMLDIHRTHQSFGNRLRLLTDGDVDAILASEGTSPEASDAG